MHTMNRMQKLVLLLGVVCAVPARASVVCGTSQYIPNPDDCGSFYECANGVPTLVKCKPGLVFSVTSSTCNYPALAQCGSSGSANTSPSTSADLPNYYCPEVDGSTAYIYPNPSSCSSYYMCAGGSLHYYQCQTGLEYSVEERGCDYPERAKCNLNNLPSFPTGPTTPADHGPTPSYYCPEVDGSTAYIYPNPSSCSSYYMCAGGSLHYYQCQTGLEYSVEERGCDYPERAKCNLNNLPSFPTGPTTPAYHGPTPSYYCPEVDGPTAYIYPNPSSCSSYYMCAGGSLHYYQCQTGLEYSVEERGCDYPERAKCNLNNLPSFPTGPTTPADHGPTPSYYCPEVDGPTAYIYPNPSSCSSYYMCAGGSLHYYQCQTGLEYSVEERGCDYPERAKCNLNNLPSFPTGPTTPAYHGPTPSYYCPEVDGPTAYIYPNPSSCSSYYMCAGGSLHYYQCQTGLEYSVEERGCDYPERAKCNLNNLPSFPTGPTTPADHGPTTPADHGPTPSYYCPEVDGPTAYIYPNPSSCSSYYMCAGGSLHYYQCQTGLEYSVEERGCDYPDRAKCNLTNLPSFPSGPTAPSVTISSTYPSPDISCPVNVVTLVRDPKDCSKYYVCNYGTPIIEPCPSGLYFNQQSQECDYPNNVPECKVT